MSKTVSGIRGYCSGQWRKGRFGGAALKRLSEVFVIPHPRLQCCKIVRAGEPSTIGPRILPCRSLPRRSLHAFVAGGLQHTPLLFFCIKLLPRLKNAQFAAELFQVHVYANHSSG